MRNGFGSISGPQWTSQGGQRVRAITLLLKMHPSEIRNKDKGEFVSRDLGTYREGSGALLPRRLATSHVGLFTFKSAGCTQPSS